MLFRWSRKPEESRASAGDELRALLQGAMPEASADDAAIVASVAGLMAFVAYADRQYGAEEQTAVKASLARVHGLPDNAGGAVADLLAARVAELAHESLPTYTRVLYELTDRSARLELFDVLMNVAVADQVLSMDETNGLRRIANLLGLSEQDYQASQAAHRGRLSVLSEPKK